MHAAQWVRPTPSEEERTVTERDAVSERIGGAETDLRSIRERFGGADIVAASLGMFVSLGVLVFLGALITAGAGGIDYQLNMIDVDGNLQDVEVIGSIVAIVFVFVSFLVGGWATGRMARYDGAINGMGSALLFVFLVAIFGALGIWVGAEYNAFANAGLPDWFSQFGSDDLTLKAAAAAAAGIVASLLAGYIGGSFGADYHTRADAALVQETMTQDPAPASQDTNTTDR